MLCYASQTAARNAPDVAALRASLASSQKQANELTVKLQQCEAHGGELQRHLSQSQQAAAAFTSQLVRALPTAFQLTQFCHCTRCRTSNVDQNESLTSLS